MKRQRERFTLKYALKKAAKPLLRTLTPQRKIRLREALKVIAQLDYDRTPILIHVDSGIELRTRLFSCKKEPDTVRWIEENLQTGQVFFDLGANIGPYSLIAAKYKPGVKVFAFEPSFVNFHQLCRNIILNNCQEFLCALPLAIGNTDSLEKFHYSGVLSGSAHNALCTPVDEFGRPFSPQFVQSSLSVKLDTLITQFGFPAPHHIKIDVDGNELEILKGSRHLLSMGTVLTINVEVSEGDKEHALMQSLNEFGYLASSKHPRRTPGMWNMIFKHSAS